MNETVSVREKKLPDPDKDSLRNTATLSMDSVSEAHTREDEDRSMQMEVVTEPANQRNVSLFHKLEIDANKI